MKAAPGAVINGEAIIGRNHEIAQLWQKLEGNSVLFTAERRVGKTSIIEKMHEHPSQGWGVLKCLVESKRHPSEMVGEIHEQALRQAALSRKTKWRARFTSAYEKLAGAGVGGWRLPPVERAWKVLLTVLIEGFAEPGEPRIVIVLDEFPHMLSNMLDDGQPGLAAEVLDTLRELRQRYQAAGRFRFLLTGSIGLHLVVAELKDKHGYTGNPVNDLEPATLGGMRPEDVALMCTKYLDEERIQQTEPDRFVAAMCRATDSLPLYVAYVCSRFQRACRSSVGPADITKELQAMLLDSDVQWFSDALERVEKRYKRLGMDRISAEVLRLLCRGRRAIAEDSIIEALVQQGLAADSAGVVQAFDLLLRDHYLKRSVSRGRRHYAFKYEIMRRWWHLTRG